MRRLLLVGAAMVLLSLSAAAAYISRPAREPRLTAVEPVIDLGTTTQGSILEGSFELINSTPNSIDVSKIQASCDCTDAEVSPGLVSPGGHAKVHAKWNVRAGRGSHSTAIYLFPKESGSVGFISLRMTANVKPDIDYSPSKLQFVRGKAESTVLAFVPGIQRQIQLKKAYATQRAFTATLNETDKSVRVTFDPGKLSPDDNPAEVVVETNSVHEPTCRIPILVTEGRT